LQYIIETDALSNIYSQSISNAFNSGTNAVSYPDTDLSNQLKTVARLISGGLETKIYMVRISGFDTHNVQIASAGSIEGIHKNLLQEVSGAVEAFLSDLQNQTLDEDVVGLTFSEFGRKAQENGNLGTDHGEIAPMFVFGKPVNGGVSGVNVDVSEATAQNNFQIETVQYDYRQTFGTLLQDFLGASDVIIDTTFFNHTFNESFTNSKIHELLKGEYSVAQGCYSDTLSIEDFDLTGTKNWLVYPNPVGETLQLSSIRQVGFVKYKLYNYVSHLVKQGETKLINNKANIDTRNLAPGIYILQIFSEGSLETHKLVKR
jgi:hypothetical protein